MQTTTLGRTGLRVSVMGLGCGGPSRLGQTYSQAPEESARVVREALELGINMIDTAEAYGTEPFVGDAIRGVPRESLVISTKKSTGARVQSAEEIVAGCEASLERLGTDYIDIYHLHGVSPRAYPEIRDEALPALRRLQEEGKVRFIGVTEAFERDSGHEMLGLALEDDCWDVVMVGFNLLNQSARERVLPRTLEKSVGTQLMFAVGRAFSRPERLREILAGLAEEGRIDASLAESEDPLGFLVEQGGAVDLTDAAYRFCRYEAGIDVVLSGTGSVEHLRRNVESLARPPLAEEACALARELFRRVDNVSGS